MNLSIQDGLHLFANELKRYLSPHILQHLAQKTGFVKRKSKYGARDLTALCIWINQHVASDSLTRLCSQLYTNTATLISPEELNQRFNPATVAFLREVTIVNYISYIRGCFLLISIRFSFILL